MSSGVGGGGEREEGLMFMKHYAPNRCLYLKVEKLRTGVGCGQKCHTYKITVSKDSKSTADMLKKLCVCVCGGGGSVLGWGGGQGGCD